MDTIVIEQAGGVGLTDVVFDSPSIATIQGSLFDKPGAERLISGGGNAGLFGNEVLIGGCAGVFEDRVSGKVSFG